jgi:hypothetical protein
VSQSVLIHPYETLTAERNPLTSKVMRHPHGQTLKQLDAFVDSTWNNCLYPFEKCLIRVEKYNDPSSHTNFVLTVSTANGVISIRTSHVLITSQQRKSMNITKKLSLSIKARNFGREYRGS